MYSETFDVPFGNFQNEVFISEYSKSPLNSINIKLKSCGLLVENLKEKMNNDLIKDYKREAISETQLDFSLESKKREEESLEREIIKTENNKLRFIVILFLDKFQKMLKSQQNLKIDEIDDFTNNEIEMEINKYFFLIEKTIQKYENDNEIKINEIEILDENINQMRVI